MEERLQKLIARAGLASRRAAESLIETRAVRVNGRIVDRLGAKADPARDTITVDGKRLRFPDTNYYFLFHKPRGTVCAASDPQRRPTIFDRLGRLPARVFPVGRLPYEVDGLLLLTNDGDFADKISRGHLQQTFALKLKGRVDDAVRQKLARQAARFQSEPLVLRQIRRGANPWYEVRVTRPQSDWLRTLLFRAGHPVEKMTRTGVGTLRDSGLRPGQFRELTPGERNRLLREAAAVPPKRPGGSARRKKIG